MCSIEHMRYLTLVLREWMQSRTASDYDVSLRPLSEELGGHASPWGRSRVLLCSGTCSTPAYQAP